jgi:hypothetical protein
VKRRALIAGGSLLALVAAFLAGRFSRPAEVKTETVTVYATHAKESGSLSIDSGQKTKERIVTVTKREPGGTVYVTETTDRLLSSDLALDLGWARETEANGETKATTTTKAQPSWRLEGQAGWSRLSPSPDLYGIGISRRVVGTVWVGGWARTDKTAGLGLALEF